MGTNYYGRLKKPIKRVVEDYKEFHIGKSSYGWKFCFQKGEYFRNFEEFKKWLQDDDYEIYDEYEEKVNKKEFLQMIINKQKEKNNQWDYDDTENIGGFNFSDYDFS